MIVMCSVCGAFFGDDKGQRSEIEGKYLKVSECPFCGTRHYEIENEDTDNSDMCNSDSDISVAREEREREKGSDRAITS